jgi:hypothetical protein
MSQEDINKGIAAKGPAGKKRLPKYWNKLIGEAFVLVTKREGLRQRLRLPDYGYIPI